MAKPARVSSLVKRAARVGGCLALACAPVLVGAAPTARAESTATVADRTEAWYTIAPADACTSPVGCPPATVPTSPFPADTLHVGVAAGQETSRTYVVPDLTSLPFGSTATSGTMTLPLASDNQSGVVQPASAHLDACLATAPPADGTQGTPTTPPNVDTTVCSGANYDASASDFTIDLAPFLQAWAAGKPQDGIALMTSPGTTAQTDAWHVAFNGKNRAGTPHISSSLTYTAAPDSGLGGFVPPAQPVTPAQPPAQAPPNLGTPSTTSVAPQAAPPQVAPAPAQPQTQPVAFVGGFQYPMVFLMPLALLAGAVFFVRLFTRNPLPLEARPLEARPSEARSPQ